MDDLDEQELQLQFQPAFKLAQKEQIKRMPIDHELRRFNFDNRSQ